jgi:hypothetical protein
LESISRNTLFLTVNKTDDQQVNTLELVLKEMPEEQQKANQLGADLVSAINQLSNRVEGFNEKLENQAIISPPVATKPIEEVAQTGITKMEILVASQPKNVVKKNPDFAISGTACGTFL